MEKKEESGPQKGEDCVVHTHPVPAGQLDRYSIDSDPHSEMDIASYLEGQAPDETVQHVERIETEIVLGTAYEIWDVTTDKDRWWHLDIAIPPDGDYYTSCGACKWTNHPGARE